MKSKESFYVEGVEINVFRRKMKSIKIAIKETGEVVVSCPKFVTIRQVVGFVQKNLEWIKKTRQVKLLKQSVKFQTGDKLCFMGKEYIIKFVDSSKMRIKIEGQNFVFYALENERVENLQKLYLAFCKRHLKKILPKYFEKWSQITGFEVEGFSVRDMKTRWGSCNPKKKTISINVHIAEKPLECLDYLVLHEIAHIKEPSHNQDFKNFLSKYMPDWKIFRKMLKK